MLQLGDGDRWTACMETDAVHLVSRQEGGEKKANKGGSSPLPPHAGWHIRCLPFSVWLNMHMQRNGEDPTHSYARGCALAVTQGWAIFKSRESLNKERIKRRWIPRMHFLGTFVKHWSKLISQRFFFFLLLLLLLQQIKTDGSFKKTTAHLLVRGSVLDVEIVEEHSSGTWLEDRKTLTGVGVKIIL